MKRKIKSNDSGITLIALVVTIIVLIILVGIVVATLMGDNGIIKRAGDAKEAQRGATVQDEVTLAIAENEMIDQLNSVNGGQENKKTKTDIVNELAIKGYLTSDDETTLETEDEITIGGIKIDFSRLTVSAGEGNNPSQYVPYDNPYIPTNFSHVGIEDWNSGFTIKGDAGTTNENDEFVWVPCVLDQANVKTGDTVQIFGKITAETDYTNNLTLPNASFIPEDSTVEEIRTSVGTYGGFYIAKYEAGIAGTTDNFRLATRTATDGSVRPLSQAGVGVWNSITRENCLTVSKAMIPIATTGVKSTLISGECWDTTLAWITETADSSYAENSEGKGWYIDVSSSKIHTTGYYGTDTNKIYDMAGNVWELTSKNCWYDEEEEDIYRYVVSRGGDYRDTGSDHPASCLYFGGEGANGSFGFRVVIYK